MSDYSPRIAKFLTIIFLFSCSSLSIGSDKAEFSSGRGAKSFQLDLQLFQQRASSLFHSLSHQAKEMERNRRELVRKSYRSKKSTHSVRAFDFDDEIERFLESWNKTTDMRNDFLDEIERNAFNLTSNINYTEEQKLAFSRRSREWRRRVIYEIDPIIDRSDTVVDNLMYTGSVQGSKNVRANSKQKKIPAYIKQEVIESKED